MFNDIDHIYSKYKLVQENLGTGHGTPTSIEVTKIGSNALPNSKMPGSGVEDNEVEYDGEIDMARNELYKLIEYSQKLYDIVSAEDNLEGWVSSKITKASDYISSVFHYMDHKNKMGEVEDYD